MILHRREKAFDWLLDLIVHGDQASAKFIVEQLAIYGTDKKLRKDRSDDRRTGRGCFDSSFSRNLAIA